MMKQKTKTNVHLLQNTISRYRVPIYNMLSDKYDLTVMFSYGDIPKEIQFKTIRVKVTKVCKFTLYKENIFRIAKKYDVVLAMMDPFWIQLLIIAILPWKAYKYITWGIGVPASYSVRYDAYKRSFIMLKLMVKKSDAVIFYSDYPLHKYKKFGVPDNKMFVAHNTVRVSSQGQIMGIDKDIFLFVGSLYEAKGIGVLLTAYCNAKKKNECIPDLYIIGDGKESSKIKKEVSHMGVSEQVHFTGAIYDEEELRLFFARAIICISPHQAGLSVQKAMGYGVPFVTSEDAFTGGERFDINNNVTGVLYENDSDLENILVDAAYNKSKYIKMGDNAKEFYYKFRTIENMADGCFGAIEYVMENM